MSWKKSCSPIAPPVKLPQLPFISPAIHMEMSPTKTTFSA